MVESAFLFGKIKAWLLNSAKVFYIWTKSNIIENLFYYILHYSFLLPPLLFLLLLHKIGGDFKILTLVLYCISIFIFLLVEEYIPLKIRFPLFTLLEFSFFATLVFQQLKLKPLKIALVGLSIAFYIFHGLYYFAQSKKRFDSLPIGIETILIFVFVFFFLYEQLKDVTEEPIFNHYFFWFSIGLFVYLAGSFFIYLSASSISEEELNRYWFFTYIVEIIKNLLITLAIIIHSKNPKPTKRTETVPHLDFTQ